MTGIEGEHVPCIQGGFKVNEAFAVCLCLFNKLLAKDPHCLEIYCDY